MWKRVSSTIGRMVRVVTPDGELVGTAVDIGDDGSLIVVGRRGCPAHDQRGRRATPKVSPSALGKGLKT